MSHDINELLAGEMNSRDNIEILFKSLDKILLDKSEILLDFNKVTFISVLFLERLENFVQRARDLNVRVQIFNIHPTIYKVFQVAKVKSILEVCV